MNWRKPYLALRLHTLGNTLSFLDALERARNAEFIEGVLQTVAARKGLLLAAQFNAFLTAGLEALAFSKFIIMTDIGGARGRVAEGTMASFFGLKK